MKTPRDRVYLSMMPLSIALLSVTIMLWLLKLIMVVSTLGTSTYDVHTTYNALTCAQPGFIL